MLRVIPAFVIVLLVALPAPLWAGGDGHEYHRNDFGVFVGATTPVDEEAGGKTTGTLGLDYERRFTPTMGLGIFVEILGDAHHREDLFAVDFTYRIGGFRLGIGPGLELVEEDKSDGSTKTSSHFVIVTRANYLFHVRDIIIAPTFGVDLVGETKTNLIYGVTVGVGF